MQLDLLPDEQTLERIEEAREQGAPRPSYAPFFLALGITMLFWGLTTSPVMSVGGAAILAWSLWMWIDQIAQAWRN